jgi:protein gp37
VGKNSSIEWTHHTFNPWWGCEKVSPACRNCYAESVARRFGHGVWGAKAPRRFFGENHWREPLRWNAVAEIERERKRVFCASMADVFEARVELNPARARLWELVGLTPWLDWLLLTKRPEAVTSLIRWGRSWPENVWIGTTVENQEWADRRLPHLARIPAARRFLSCEPLLGSVDLSPWLAPANPSRYPVDWVIAGGESGPSARPMLPAWPAELRDACRTANVPFFFKQWGSWTPSRSPARPHDEVIFDAATMRTFHMRKVSKIAARRDLDGRTWDEIPW